MASSSEASVRSNLSFKCCAVAFLSSPRATSRHFIAGPLTPSLLAASQIHLAKASGSSSGRANFLTSSSMRWRGISNPAEKLSASCSTRFWVLDRQPFTSMCAGSICSQVMRWNSSWPISNARRPEVSRRLMMMILSGPSWHAAPDTPGEVSTLRIKVSSLSSSTDASRTAGTWPSPIKRETASPSSAASSNELFEFSPTRGSNELIGSLLSRRKCLYAASQHPARHSKAARSLDEVDFRQENLASPASSNGSVK